MRTVEVHYSLIVSEGTRTVSKTGRKCAHSFTAQFTRLLFNTLFNLSPYSPSAMTTTSGASVTTDAGMDTAIRTDAGAGTSSQGIQVGTGTAAESIADTALQTQIAHGTGVGMLQYGAMTYGAPSTTATTTTFRLTRVFTNGSGGTVTVQELGLVGRDTGAGNSFLFIRDLTGAVTVNNGQQVTVNYDLTTTI